jgi:cytochrome c oxidase assembly factor CtaG
MGRMDRAIRRGLGLGAGITLAAVGIVQAHGDPTRPPSLPLILTTWSGEPLPWIGIGIATAIYVLGVRLTNRAHPLTPVPPARVAAWLTGMLAIAIALVSAVDVYATSLLSAHMVQHLLLTMVAPPLLALGAPITLVLRLAPSGPRHTIILPVLNSRVVHAITWPPVGWIVFAVVMWATHFSPLFNAALEDPLLHNLEHLLYLSAGILFWWPVIGADPIRWRLRPAWRMAYLAGQMPFNAAVGLAIYFAPAVLYAHYRTVDLAWGPDPMTDQQVAGILMWGVGDVILLAALILAIAAWLRADERLSRRLEVRAGRRDERPRVEGP